MSNSVSLYGVSSFFYEITEGFASASPDYETTSQQDNKRGFAALRQTTTSTYSL